MNTRLTQIEATLLTQFQSYKAADKRVDEKRGLKDGMSNLPAPDAEIYPFHRAIVTEAQAVLRRYNDQIDNLINELERQITSLWEDLDARYGSTRDSIIGTFQNAAERLEQTLGPRSVKHDRLQRKHQEFSDRERQLEVALGRPLRINMRYVYYFIMAGVALVELPINRFAFELYFSETPALSAMIALGIGLGLMLLAHFGGIWIKRCTATITPRQRTLYIVGAVSVALLIVPTLFLIALLRQHYVKFIEAQQITFGEMLNQEGLGNIARDVIGTDMGTSGWMLFMINLLIVGIGVIVAVVRHDAHPDYEKIVRTRERTERQLDRIKGKFERHLTDFKKKQDLQLAELVKQQDRIERQIEELKNEREKCIAHKDQTLEAVFLHLKQRLHSYETGNQQGRSSESPAFFWRMDEASLKDDLRASLKDEHGSVYDILEAKSENRFSRISAVN
ncbi:MAG: hypothetical protein OEU46_13575 [Alphaproteobacteria bacterium]|nr:hypothetical protein [Alphaproteobacteria bacterium]